MISSNLSSTELGVGGGVGRGRGVGVSLCVEESFSVTTTTNCDWLGIPLVKTVTSACPMGKPLELWSSE